MSQQKILIKNTIYDKRFAIPFKSHNDIRKQFDNGLTINELADIYNADPRTIKRIVDEDYKNKVYNQDRKRRERNPQPKEQKLTGSYSHKNRIKFLTGLNIDCIKREIVDPVSLERRQKEIKEYMKGYYLKKKGNKVEKELLFIMLGIMIMFVFMAIYTFILSDEINRLKESVEILESKINNRRNK